MNSRQTLDEAIAHAGAVSRNDSSKWRPLEHAFASELGTSSDVKGTLLTDEKQLKTRMVELGNADPRYAVLSIVVNGGHDVRLERVREWLSRSSLPAARCALIVQYDQVTREVTPVELQVYQADPVVAELAAVYDLHPIDVERPESRRAPLVGSALSSLVGPEPTGFEALEQAWHSTSVVADWEEWDELRERAAPEYRLALDEFLNGHLDVSAFRSRIDSLSKTKGYWGFRGAGQMFFNQLVNAAEPSELGDVLRAVLRAPTSPSDAEASLKVFLAAVDRIRERAKSIGATPPGRGRVNSFVSFFWELADRESWPTFHPNSRDVLEQYGLLDTSLPQPSLYTAYDAVIQRLKALLDTTTWGVEHLLWLLGKGAPESEVIAPEVLGDEEEVQAGTDLYASYRAQGLYFPDEVVTSLVLSLATKRFVILAGISGTGKTQIALGLARHLESAGGEPPDAVPPLSPLGDAANGSAPSPRRHVLLAVRSDWTDPRALLGFFNPLTGSYDRTAVVDLLLRAADDPDHAYVVVLDEMNLARVEYYFSDFLSALESGDPIELMSPGVAEELLAHGQEDVPARLHVPPNVSFVGTVNVDETTHAFSPKVLDRANVIEFSEVDVERALGYPAVEDAPGMRVSGLRAAWFCTTRSQALEPASVAHAVETFTEALEDVHDLLSRFDRQFGYRVIEEVSAFVGHALQKVAGDPEETVRRAFDLQLQQKVIPKLAGGRELEGLLTLLLAYCSTGSKTKAPDVEEVRIEARSRLDPSQDAEGTERPRHPNSARKLLRMLDRLADTGFVAAVE